MDKLLQRKRSHEKHIHKHRGNLRDLTRTAYGFLRFVIVLYGLATACGYIFSPIVKTVLVPDFAIHIFIPILGILWIAEIVWRMTDYSCEVYSYEYTEKEEKCVSGCEAEYDETGKEKLPFLYWLATKIFPFRGIHIGLLGTWIGIALYYYFYFVVMSIQGNSVFLPENFPLSFYIVSGACALDFLAKGIFVLRIPEVGKFFTQIAGMPVQNEKYIFWWSLTRFFRAIFRA